MQGTLVPNNTQEGQVLDAKVPKDLGLRLRSSLVNIGYV